MLSRRPLILAAALVLAAPALALAQGGNVAELIRAEPRFSTLATAIDAAGLAPALSGPDAITVLAPTNEAFAALPPGTLDNLLKPENREQLATVLKHHVLAGRQDGDALKKRRDVTPLSGKPLQVELKRGKLEIGGVRVAGRDRNATNGVVHAVEAVLLP